MFNKTIFKNTFKSNFKLWIIITVVLCIFNAVIIAVFDPKTINSLSDLVKDTPLSNMIQDTTFLGMMSQVFYTIHAIILPLVFIIIVANNLVVSQVDRGSMAYLLSTPIKRRTVVGTQAIYFTISLFAMILILTITGIFSIQMFHGGVWGTKYTKDVVAVSKMLDIEKEELSNDLEIILNDDEAIKEGAKAREIDEDTYKIYLNLKIEGKTNSEESFKQSSEMQEKIFEGINKASEVLDIEESELASDMGIIKENKKALDAAVEGSGLPKEMFIQIINNQIATNEVSVDEGIDFDIYDYAMINLGLFLLMFATSGISFMFSCIFNLSKYYMALGGGIPVAFFLFKMMESVSEDLEKMKYFTINSLFDTNAIISGGDYILNFIVLVILGIILYTIGICVFQKKDLPL